MIIRNLWTVPKSGTWDTIVTSDLAIWVGGNNFRHNFGINYDRKVHPTSTGPRPIGANLATMSIVNFSAKIRPKNGKYKGNKHQTHNLSWPIDRYWYHDVPCKIRQSITESRPKHICPCMGEKSEFWPITWPNIIFWMILSEPGTSWDQYLSIGHEKSWVWWLFANFDLLGCYFRENGRDCVDRSRSLQTQPKSWSIRWNIWVSHYLKLVSYCLRKFLAKKPPENWDGKMTN